MVQWINHYQNNRSVLGEKTGPMLLWLVGLMAGKQAQADEIRVDFEIFKILYRLTYSDFYFV